jgi:hypothetical protein
MNTEEIVCNRCGSVNDYKTEQAGPHIKAICNGCDKYIKFLGQDGPFILPFGKFKGSIITSLKSREEVEYLKWLLSVSKSNIAKKIESYLKSIAAI